MNQLNDAQEILSDYLIAFATNTKERQLKTSDVDAREIILKGKLGKRGRYQESMKFGE